MLNLYSKLEKRKAVVTDLDDTLIMSGGNPNQSLLNYLQRKNEDGYNIIIVSGRSNTQLQTTRNWLEKYNCPHTAIHLSDFPSGPNSSRAFKVYKAEKLLNVYNILEWFENDAETRSKLSDLGINVKAPSSVKSIDIFAKYSPDQPRDERGRFGSSDGSSSEPTLKFHPDAVKAAYTGAKSYAEKNGIKYNEKIDYTKTVANRERAAKIADEYDKLPKFDENAKPAYDKLASEVDKQYEFMTKELGIKVEFVADDPYKTSKEMFEEVSKGTLRVLDTKTTGSHSYLSDDVNNRFRAVHDFFGHAATGRGFGQDGEESAWVHHSQMFSMEARAALTTETRGQNSWYNTRQDGFAEQKTALLPSTYWEVPTTFEKSISKTVAIGNDDYNPLEIYTQTAHTTNGRTLGIQPGQTVLEYLRNSKSHIKYSEDQPRDERGRFGSTGGSNNNSKYVKGKWSEVSSEEARAKFKENYSLTVTIRGEGTQKLNWDELRQLEYRFGKAIIPKSDYDFARNGREIKNGSITIRTSNTRIKDEDLKKVSVLVDKNMEKDKLENLTIRIGEINGRTLGSNVHDIPFKIGDKQDIFLSSKLFNETKLAEINASDVNAWKVNGNVWSMVTDIKTGEPRIGQLEGTLIHEWGHAITAQYEQKGIGKAYEDIRQIYINTPGNLASDYAKFGIENFKVTELVAESYLDYRITNGNTDNELTQKVANYFKWEK